jgi:uncharacterized protein (TIGR00725 family)
MSEARVTLRRLIGVLGSGTDEHADLAEPLGRWLAEEGYDLLTGGGQGVMAAACRGFAAVPGRRGVSVGVLPGDPATPGTPPPPGYPNPWVDVVIRTHLPKRGEEGADVLSRNHINVLSSEVAVALPGGPGTRTEVELARRYGRPLVAYLGPAGTIDGLDRAALPAVAVTLEEVIAFVKKHLG